MVKPLIDARTFDELFEKYGAAETARRLGCTERAVYFRRENREKELKRQLTSPTKNANSTRHRIKHPDWLTETIENGIVIVFSDAHYWPGIVTAAHKAVVKFCRELKPRLLIANGDMLDGSMISRFTPIGWERRPELIEELETTQERLGEIERAAGKARKIWTLGNHDGRFETKLATLVPEYAKIKGVHLKDHFPLWEPCWSICINDNTVVKHRYRGGVHAVWNNVVHSGRSIVTGHLHNGYVRPFSDYNGTRFGVDTGMVAEPYGEQFEDYTEQNPANWRSSFGVLTYHKGRLLQPQLALVLEDGTVDYCGKVYEV